GAGAGAPAPPAARRPAPGARGPPRPPAGAPASAPPPPLEGSAPWRRPLVPPAPAAPPLLGVLGLAFLGGLILNLMPCVLPVLAIKVVGFARSAGERKLAHGAAYALGAQGALAVAAAAVLVLRAVGTEVGWGFQFQQPIFVARLGGIPLPPARNASGLVGPRGP